MSPRGVFDVLAGADPSGLALVTPSGRLTYGELDSLCDRAAGALHTLGVRPGDRVAASLPNDTDIVVAFHGAMRLGAIWLGINQALAPPERQYMLDDAGASTYLTTGNVADFRAALEESAGRADVAPPDPFAPAAIAYTSGTTGFPKGAVHCQAGLIQPGAATVARRGWGPTLRKGDSLPLTILNMHVLTTLLTAQAGGTCVIRDQADVASIAGWIEDQLLTVWNGVPAQLYTMVHDPSIESHNLARLSEVWVGGADCPDRLRDAFEAKFGVPVSRTYGLTESPALVCLDDIGPAADRPSGTSGRPLDHVALTIAEDGEIVLGPPVTGDWAGRYRPALGYWPSTDAPPVLPTGDLGELEAGGHLRVIGRKSQVIIRGGANVYPAEVERVLMEAPGVAACAVVGVPDERLGERVGAAVEARPGAPLTVEALRDHCRESLAAYKVPDRVVIVDSLPRNQMGKIPRPDVVRLLSSCP